MQDFKPQEVAAKDRPAQDAQIAASKLWSKYCTQDAINRGTKWYVYEVSINLALVVHNVAVHSCKLYDEEGDRIVDVSPEVSAAVRESARVVLVMRGGLEAHCQQPGLTLLTLYTQVVRAFSSS